MKRALIAGGGGFIGGHLAAGLLREGIHVRVADVKPLEQWYQRFADAENIVADLKHPEACQAACRDVDEVYNLAADMGGMGFIENNKALCMLSVLINTHLLQAALEHHVGRYFFASSACVYNVNKQNAGGFVTLAEDDAYPAMPEDGYGWEKLFSERMCLHFREDFGLQTRIARFNNVYGPYGAWRGGRERAPAAMCRKVIEAKETGKHAIEIWGDGSQTRSFTYVTDCVRGVIDVARSEILEPINLSAPSVASINELVDALEQIAGIKLERQYKLDAPQGVQGMNSDTSKMRQYLGWEPSTPLRDGLAETYRWIHAEYLKGSG